MKFVPTTLAGAVALAVAQLATAQPTTVAPNSVNIDQQGVQNSNQLGTGNTATVTQGS